MAAIESLSREERGLIGLYYGLNSKDLMSDNEICARMSISEEELACRLDETISKINNFSKKKRQ